MVVTVTAIVLVSGWAVPLRAGPGLQSDELTQDKSNDDVWMFDFVSFDDPTLHLQFENWFSEEHSRPQTDYISWYIHH